MAVKKPMGKMLRSHSPNVIRRSSLVCPVATKVAATNHEKSGPDAESVIGNGKWS